MLKEKFRGDKKATAKILICDKDGGERGLLAYGKMVELGFKARHGRVGVALRNPPMS